MVNHCCRCGGSLLWMCWLIIETWWLIIGDEVAHCCRRSGSLLEMWWLIVGNVVAHCWKCGGLLLEMWWLIVGNVILLSKEGVVWGLCGVWWVGCDEAVWNLTQLVMFQPPAPCQPAHGSSFSPHSLPVAALKSLHYSQSVYCTLYI